MVLNTYLNSIYFILTKHASTGIESSVFQSDNAHNLMYLVVVVYLDHPIGYVAVSLPSANYGLFLTRNSIVQFICILFSVLYGV